MPCLPSETGAQKQIALCKSNAGKSHLIYIHAPFVVDACRGLSASIPAVCGLKNISHFTRGLCRNIAHIGL